MTGLSWHCNHRVKSLGKALPFCLFAAIAAAFLFLGTARAQEEPEYGYVDLVMLYEQGPERREDDVRYTVKNNGTAIAIGVTVLFLLEDLDVNANDLGGYAITDNETVGTTNQRFTWVVGDIPPGNTSGALTFGVGLHSGRHSEVTSAYKGRIAFTRATASSSTPEPRALLANNNVKVYSFASDRTRTYHMGDKRLALLLSVDDLRPAVEGDVNFGLTAEHLGRAESVLSDIIDLISDIDIRVTLSDGLEFKSGWTWPDGFVTSGQSATWTPEAVDSKVDHSSAPALMWPDSRDIQIQTQLTSDSLTAIPLEERCITAWVEDSTPPPTPGYVFGSLKQCLGDDPKVVFSQGKADLFTIYLCAGVATIAYPCRDDNNDMNADNGLEMVATALLTDQPIRRSGIGRSDFGEGVTSFGVSLRPESIVVQVDDPGGRAVDGSNNLAWWTRYPGGLEPTLNNSSQSSSNWTEVRWEIASVRRPSNGHIHIYNEPRSFNIVNTNGKPQHPVGGGLTSFAGSLKTNFEIDVKFDTLGTYVVDFTQETKNNNGTTGNTADDVGYLAKGRYTFHVGPIAELEARDGEANPAVPARQQAYSIVAVNNGPDAASAAQVTLGLDEASCTGHPTKGSIQFDSNESECVWTIGELITKDVSQAARGRDGEVLTIITSAAVDTEITAAISNTQDYQVCIDSSGDDVVLTTPSSTACTTEDATNSWHTTEYYDYNDGNNSATIKARAGTGAELPVIQSVEAVGPAAIKITWSEITEISGRPVTHYEVERETNPREVVADNVTGTRYVDTDMEAGENPRYRVRAVNDWEQEGPWSLPSGGRPGAPGDFSATVDNGQIALSWSAPQGVTVTGYHLDYSTDGGSTWNWLPAGQTRSALAATPTSYNHTGLTLTPGAVWHYRLRAVGDGFTSDWEEASVTVPYPKPGIPVDFTATGQSETQAELTWTAPGAVTHVRVTGYEVDFSQDGGVTWTSLATPATLGQSATSYTHTNNNLAAEAVRQYRARTVGAVGSVTVESDYAYALATENYPSPGAPRDFAAAAASDTMVNLTWNAPEAVVGVNLTGYELEVSIDRGVTWISVATASTLGSGATTHTHTDAANPLSSKPRQYRLKAVGTVGGSTYESGWVFAVPAEAVGPPQNLTATADGRNRIDLTWGQPGFGAEAVTGYRIDHAPAAAEDWRTLEHGYRTSPRRYEHTGLLPGERHCYRVAATYAGGTGPFTARACATTEAVPAGSLPGEPENLRIAQVGSNYVTLEWDPPSVGGPVEYYEYRSNIHNPVEVSPKTATSVTVRGLSATSTYNFQVRAGNSYGPGVWSQPIHVALNRAGSAVKATPAELEVDKGGSGSFNVSLNRSPQWPLALYFVWEGPDCLTESLLYQQGKILLPTNPPPSKEFWEDFWWGPPEDRFARLWNAGLDIWVDASRCQGGETAVVNYDVWSLPFSYLEGLSLWDHLGLNLEEWRDKWGVDPLNGVSGSSVKVTVSDSGTQ